MLSLELSTEAEVHHPFLKRAHQAKAYMVFGLNMTYALRWIYACIEELCMLKVQGMSLCTIAS